MSALLDHHVWPPCSASDQTFSLCQNQAAGAENLLWSPSYSTDVSGVVNHLPSCLQTSKYMCRQIDIQI